MLMSKDVRKTCLLEEDNCCKRAVRSATPALKSVDLEPHETSITSAPKSR